MKLRQARKILKRGVDCLGGLLRPRIHVTTVASCFYPARTVEAAEARCSRSSDPTTRTVAGGKVR